MSDILFQIISDILISNDIGYFDTRGQIRCSFNVPGLKSFNIITSILLYQKENWLNTFAAYRNQPQIWELSFALFGENIRLLISEPTHYSYSLLVVGKFCTNVMKIEIDGKPWTWNDNMKEVQEIKMTLKAVSNVMSDPSSSSEGRGMIYISSLKSSPTKRWYSPAWSDRVISRSTSLPLSDFWLLQKSLDPPPPPHEKGRIVCCICSSAHPTDN